MKVSRFIGILVLASGCGGALPSLDLYLENATDPVLRVFEDESIAIRFTTTREHLEFDLENKTNGAIRILWDEIVFEDSEGRRHSVCHSGADFANPDAPQEPTSVGPRSRIQDHLIPEDHITPSKKDPGGWDISPLLVPEGESPADTRRLASQVVGRKVRVVMPLSIGGRREAYRFRFKITPVAGPGGRGETLKTRQQERTPVVK